MDQVVLKGANGTYVFSPGDKQSILGEGGTGRIFRGADANTGKTVAIKVLFKHLTRDVTNVKRLRIESEIDVSHPNLIKNIDFVHDGERDIYHLVSEFIKGKTLASKLDEVKNAGTSLSVKEVKDIGLAVASALEALHNHIPQVIHRDVDPSNIMLCADGTVKLMDLGIAKVGSPDEGKKLTMVGSIIGKQHYLSPEQINNSAEVALSPASDLYSLGITLYECITGEVPYQGSSEFEIYQKHQKALLPRHKLLTKALYTFLVNATAKAPENRYRTAPAFKAALSAIGDDGLTNKRLPLIYNPRRKFYYAVASVILSALVFSLYLVYGNYEKKVLISESCGSMIKVKELSPLAIQDPIKSGIVSMEAPVSLAASEISRWKGWLNNPTSFNGYINEQGIVMDQVSKKIPRNRLLMKILLELKDASLGDRAKRISIINAIPWNDTGIVDKALNGPLRTNILVQLDDVSERAKMNLRHYLNSIEAPLAASANYERLYRAYEKADLTRKASRYALLANKIDVAEGLADISVSQKKDFESQLQLANVLAAKGRFDPSYSKYVEAFASYSNTPECQSALQNALEDLSQIQIRKDMNVNNSFLLFVQGLLYQKGSNFNSGYRDQAKDKFKCFKALASDEPAFSNFIDYVESASL
jgi:serine/threonine protein kinase